MRHLGAVLVLGLAACAAPKAAERAAPTEIEGLVRRRDPSCGPRNEFVMAVGSTPVGGRRFSIRQQRVDGAEVASVVTSDEGAFRASLPPGRYCFVDTTEPGVETGCVGVLTFDPSVESIPIVTLPPTPCPG
ncbi:MAG: hypothetical protein Q8N26_15200 [Myxococcales bacterium]|nr:hypothetical protein [Myxococcales bacterium]